jgi:hypothetical protein
MNTLRAPLIAALTMISWAAFAQQVRVITPDSEHVYSADPRLRGLIFDDEELQLKNERAQRAKALRQLERENTRRQDEMDAEFERLRVERAQAAAQAWQDMEDARVRDAGGQDNLAFGRRRNR